MQVIVHTTGDTPNLTAIEDAIAHLDPAVVLDVDATGHGVRISAAVTEYELLACLRKAGLDAEPQQLVRLPSECCGGCGG